MSRKALILEELGLNPVWVRTAMLPELQIAVATSPAVPAIAPAAIARPQGLSPVAVAAHQALAPLVSTPKFTSLPVSPPANDPAEDERSKRIANMNWEELRNAVSSCTACPLCQNRQKNNEQTVFGTGPMQANIMVLGEAPDEDEEAQQTPFLGEAGRLLDNMLAAINEDKLVYKANILKCRTPNKRNPQAAEAEQCAPFLKRQIELLQPKSLFVVGRFALKTLLESDEPVSVLRERLHHYKQIPLIVSYNPSYLLRNLPDKSRAWRDLLRLKAALHSPLP
ncbi:uracil-DNA glycosylase [Iodobacter ciconiae]|uniref:Type-4 uracil-DNA glycosylase n=1 Tax=Iodobacter ciconiae TaxID=2496266 RepID=A0A3S8ZPB3_9NEIS|nr:uracil-DNA glycosylase [Iodobacter ciconiae]AZN35300.1 uracil-DNA glycosylase [Iodobacter ciconiae]